MDGRENFRLRASANRAEALYPVDLTHLCLKHNSCLVEGVSWKVLRWSGLCILSTMWASITKHPGAEHIALVS